MTQEDFYMLVAPVVLILLFLYIFSLDKVVMLITLLTPFAVIYRNAELGIGISLPTEPLMLGVLFIFVIRLFYDGGYNKKILNHPVTIAILLNLIWIFITIFTSEIPLVSVKFFLARLWFIIPFYFIGVIIFRKFKNIPLFVWLYAIPLVLVIFYTLYNHATFGFDKPSSNMVMHPFYNDHTAYGAVVAMFIPVLLSFAIKRDLPKYHRLLALSVLFVLVLGIIFSYSRAAWLSLFLSFILYSIVLFKIKFRYVLSTILLLAGLFYLFQFQLIDRLEKNKQDSSTDFLEHIQSISNISSDASNLERINRWNCAIRLFKERPFFGWGPGTYQFVYAPFQRSKEKTIISTNAGDMGNAHSEYIGPLSESGVLGMITFLVVVVTVMVTGLRVYRKARSLEVKWLSLAILLGLFSYFIHGLLNNFLDSDKASVPFWGFIAILVALDIYHKGKSSQEIVQGKDNGGS
jgi:O-antigen ligase